MTSAVEREQYQDCKLEATKQQTLRGPAEALALALALATDKLGQYKASWRRPSQS